MSEPSREGMLADALAKIAKLKPEPVADGFVTGPQALLDAAKRIAREALKQSRAAKPERERVTYTEICMNEKCPRGCGIPVEIVRALKGDPASTVAHLPNVVVTKQEW